MDFEKITGVLGMPSEMSTHFKRVDLGDRVRYEYEGEVIVHVTFFSNITLCQVEVWTDHNCICVETPIATYSWLNTHAAAHVRMDVRARYKLAHGWSVEAQSCKSRRLRKGDHFAYITDGLTSYRLSVPGVPIQYCPELSRSRW